MQFIISAELLQILCLFLFFGGRNVELGRGEICSRESPRPGALRPHVLSVHRSR